MGLIDQIRRRRSELEAQRKAIDSELADLEAAERVVMKMAPDVVGRVTQILPSVSQSAQSALSPKAKRKTIIREILRGVYPRGLQAGEIRQIARDMYGTELNPNTLTVTLGRHKEKGIVRIDGRTWYYIPEEARKPNKEAGAPTGTSGQKTGGQGPDV